MPSFDWLFSNKHAKIRGKAKELPFADVGDIIDVSGEAADYEKRERDDPLKNILFRAVGKGTSAETFDLRTPDRVIAFATSPGDGSESAVFGLAHDSQGWSWLNYCKTHFAKEFVEAHVLVIAMLDFASGLGVIQHVRDDSDYWINRSISELLNHHSEMNSLMRKTADQLRAKGHEVTIGGRIE